MVQSVMKSLAKEGYIARIFREIVISKCPSRAKMYTSGRMNLRKAATGVGNCRTFLVNFTYKS
jgi:hypothetical protein